MTTTNKAMTKKEAAKKIAKATAALSKGGYGDLADEIIRLAAAKLGE